MFIEVLRHCCSSGFKEACKLRDELVKIGYSVEDIHIRLKNETSARKMLTGIFDSVRVEEIVHLIINKHHFLYYNGKIVEACNWMELFEFIKAGEKHE